MSQILSQVLLALIAVIAVGRLLAWLFKHIGQPPVIGEVMAGILLGPSLLGSEISGYLLPETVAPYLGILAQLGVVLYMFLVGVELNASVLKSHGFSTVVISQCSMVVPFVLGGGLAIWMYPIVSDSSVPFTSFSLFMGVALSITAFPVLARILTDRGLAKTPLGILALGCAAIGDATAWCLLAIVVGIVQARVETALWMPILALAYVAFIFFVARPMATCFARRCEDRVFQPSTLAWVLVAVLCSALATEQIGIHAIFGAFLLGAVIPHDSRLAREISGKLHDVVTVFLLPAFFAYTGMRTKIGLVHSIELWLWTGIIILVATAGKFSGAFVAARMTGHGARMAASLGVLMNTRGLMELIVLNVGLELGVISPTLFAMMVLMALVTTMATTPVLDWLNRRQLDGPKLEDPTEFPTVSGSAN